MKTVDSAREALKNSKNPIDALSTISKTLDKVSKRTKTSGTQENGAQKTQDETSTPEVSTGNTVPTPLPAPSEQESPVTDPLVKNLSTEISVENVNTSRDELAALLRRYNGEIVTENYGEQDGYRKQVITAKVPYQYFDAASRAISTELGITKTRNTETAGRDYDPNQRCDMEIIFTENRQFTGAESVATDNGKLNSENSTEKGFIERFGTVGIVIAVCLILIPLMLLILYFMNRNMKKKMENEFQQNRAYPQTTTQQNYNQESSAEKPQQKEHDEDPYAKYKPKQ